MKVNRVFVHGDCHADFTRFSTDKFPIQNEMTKDDYVIICGDFGGVWNKEQWFNVETVPYWNSKYENAAVIWDNYREWSPSTYVDIEFGNNSSQYTNETNGTGLTSSIRSSHYGNNAYADLVAPAVFEKMLEAGVIE